MNKQLAIDEFVSLFSQYEKLNGELKSNLNTTHKFIMLCKENKLKSPNKAIHDIINICKATDDAVFIKLTNIYKKS